MNEEVTQGLRRREFLAWLCKIGGGATALTLGPGILPLRRVNTVLFGGTAHALEPCTEDVCATRDACETGDAGHTCQVKDVCNVDESGDCMNDQCDLDQSQACVSDACRSDSSGECQGDRCSSDSSGDCSSDQCGSDSSGACKNDSCTGDTSGDCQGDACRSDSSGGCLSDTCGRDASGACAGDSCPSDSSGECISDRCTGDSSGACVSDRCRSDSSGNCQSDRCRADSSGGCKGDVCEGDNSGECENDDCHADKSGGCLSDHCASDKSAACAADTCTVSDVSGECYNDTCNEDSSTQCVSDTCTIDTRKCESDTTCPLEVTCFMDGFCPLDGECLLDGECMVDECILDGVFSRRKPRAGGSSLNNAAIKWLYKLVALVLFLPFLTLPRGADAAVYNIPAGDVAGLIAAMEAANADPNADTINLAAGDYVLTAPYVEDQELEIYGIAGLPSVISPITINGSEAGTTTVLRSPTAEEDFCVFHVTKTDVEVSEGAWEEHAGDLTLNRLVIRGGQSTMGAGVFNERATLTVTYCTLRENVAIGDSAGGGGIANFSGTLTVVNSTIRGNTASADWYAAAGGGIENIRGEVTLRNSTLYGNTVESGDLAAGGGMSGGAEEILNVTIAGNQAALGGGLFFPDGLKNSIVVLNTADVGPDVFATTSQGYNIIKNATADSFFETGTSDLINTDPHLGAYTDSGSPGAGYLPVLSGSPAIDSADPAACTPQDQLGQNRVDACDRGAVEYVPVLCPQCSGDPVMLQDKEFPAGTNCECRANTSITIGPGVIVRKDATVTFKAPKVTVKSGSRFESGSVVNIRH